MYLMNNFIEQMEPLNYNEFGSLWEGYINDPNLIYARKMCDWDSNLRYLIFLGESLNH